MALEIEENWEVRFPNGSCGGNPLTKLAYKAVDRNLTPDYFEKKKRNEYIVPLSYSVIRKTLNAPPFQWGTIDMPTYDDKWYSNGTFASCWGEITPGVNTLVYEKDLAAVLQSRMQETNLNSAMTWFERKETFKAITSKAKMLALAYKQVRKGKFSKASKTLGITLSQRTRKKMRKRDRLDQLADNWLEYRYGWTPLYYDIYNSAHLIALGIHQAHNFVRLRTSESQSGNGGSTIWGHEVGIFGNPRDYYAGRRGMGVDYAIVDPELVLNQACGLDNPLLIAWELVPFSFVADWFIPLGDALQQITAFNGLRFVGGYEYEKTSYHFSCNSWIRYEDISRWNPDGTQHKWVPECTYVRDETTFHRTALTSFMDYRVDPWSLSSGLNVTRAADSVALLASLFRGRSA